MEKIKQLCKANKYILSAIILALFLFAVCVDNTLAWFASSSRSSKSVPLSGAVGVVAVGGSESSYPETAGNGSMQVTLPYNVLIPGGNVGMRANARIKHSTSSSLIKATVMVDLYGLRQNLGAHELEILSAVEAVIPNTWVKVENHWYYVGNHPIQTVPGATELMTVNSSAGDVNVNFINTDFIFPSKINSVVSDAQVVISVVFEAIQSFVPTSQGLPDVATINNAQRLFNESALDRIIKDNLVLHLDGLNNTGAGHDTSATVWKDLSPQNDNVTLHFNTDEANGWTSKGLRNSASNYAETSGAVNYANFDKSGNTNFTISATFVANKQSAFAGLLTNVGVNSSGAGTSGFNLMIGDYGNNMYYSNSASACDYLIPPQATSSAGYSYSIPGKVFHVTFVVDNSSNTISVYSNGNLRATISSSVINSTNNKLQFFRSYFNNSALTGDITLFNVVINNSVLSPSDVWNNFSFSMTRYYVTTDFSATNTTGLGFTYSPSNGGSYTLSDGKNASGSITIPSFIYTEDKGMLPVTSISSGSFKSNNNITEAIIEEGFENIESQGFYECVRLKKITIPSSITYIASGAFTTNVMLAEFIVDENNPSYTAVDGVLYTKDMKTLIQFPNGWKRSSTYSVPESVQIIAANSLSIPTYITQIHFGKNVSNIVEGAMTWMKPIKAFTVDPENKWYKAVDGVLYTMDMTGLVCWPPASSSLIEIPEGVTMVWGGGLAGKTTQTSLKIPSTLKEGNFYVTKNCVTMYIDSRYISNTMYVTGRVTAYGMPECSWLQVSTIKTMYIKTGLPTANSTYLAKYFTKQSSSDEPGFDKYVRTS